MQQAKNAPHFCPDQPRSVSGFEIGLTAICVTLGLTFLVLGGESLARQQGDLANSPGAIALALLQQ